ncbi:MAG TPA: hypothetical protein VFJ16_13665 [Longimicrobium sp.]|nr:hypothetical protein [Longimicrobium sp.]
MRSLISRGAVPAGLLLLVAAAPLRAQNTTVAADSQHAQPQTREQRLEELRVLAQGGGYGGFYDRVLTAGGGRFITRGDIERQNPGQTADLFRNVNGFEVVNGSIRLRGQPARSREGTSLMTRRTTAGDSLSSAGGFGGTSTINPENPDGGPASMDGRTGRGQGCIPLIWVDGRKWDSDDGNLSSIQPETIEGIEAYPRASMAPVQYRARNDNCGIVLVWLRQGS